MSDAGVAYMLAGGGRRSDWVRNLLVEPRVAVRFGTRESHEHAARARVADADPVEEMAARGLLAAKYQAWHEGEPMSEWARTALPIAVESSENGGVRA